MNLLADLSPTYFCSRTRIDLLGEAGVDAGGLQREWYTLLLQAICDPSAGLFVVNDSYRYFFDPTATSPAQLRQYRAVGRLLAKAILDEQVLPFQFCTPLFKMLLGIPLSQADVRDVDDQIYTSLQYLASSKAQVAELMLDFSVAVQSSSGVIELIPNGQAIHVTEENCDQYIQCMTQYLLFDRVQMQVEHLLTGFFEVRR
jgi:E3 ubiquitin ligase SMURF1/2